MESLIGPGETSKVLAEKQGVPVLVNPVVMKNTEGETHLGGTHEVGGDDISF